MNHATVVRQTVSYIRPNNEIKQELILYDGAKPGKVLLPPIAYSGSQVYHFALSKRAPSLRICSFTGPELWTLRDRNTVIEFKAVNGAWEASELSVSNVVPEGAEVL